MQYFIITGATGDLATTKLYPALAETFAYNLYLPEVKFLGAGRKEYSQQEYRDLIRNSLSKLTQKLDFVDNLDYKLYHSIYLFIFDFSMQVITSTYFYYNLSRNLIITYHVLLIIIDIIYIISLF